MDYISEQNKNDNFYRTLYSLFTDIITNFRKRNNKEDLTFREFANEIFFNSINKSLRRILINYLVQI